MGAIVNPVKIGYRQRATAANKYSTEFRSHPEKKRNKFCLSE
jgi:hypothetical protein